MVGKVQIKGNMEVNGILRISRGILHEKIQAADMVIRNNKPKDGQALALENLFYD